MLEMECLTEGNSEIDTSSCTPDYRGCFPEDYRERGGCMPYSLPGSVNFIDVVENTLYEIEETKELVQDFVDLAKDVASLNCLPEAFE
ncbi:MAG: hypothetical protein IJ642_05270 [Oscillospiraceae bacterium]|nr:hypothetical protein [Oscillospiraceae bacterium]